MATHVKFNKFSEDLFGKYPLSDYLQNVIVLLSSSAPNAATNEYESDIPSISYTYCSSRTFPVYQNYANGITYILLNNITLSAVGGEVGPFRYIIFCADYGADDENKLICYYDFGYSITLNIGQDLNLDFSTTNSSKGVLLTVQ